jgi:hypothetical protein
MRYADVRPPAVAQTDRLGVYGIAFCELPWRDTHVDVKPVARLPCVGLGETPRGDYENDAYSQQFPCHVQSPFLLIGNNTSFNRLMDEGIKWLVLPIHQ